jgi:hypothetical protein
MRRDEMAEKHKPRENIVHKGATFTTHPEKATPEDISPMAARILDDRRDDPIKHAAKAKER